MVSARALGSACCRLAFTVLLYDVCGKASTAPSPWKPQMARSGEAQCWEFGGVGGGARPKDVPSRGQWELALPAGSKVMLCLELPLGSTLDQGQNWDWGASVQGKAQSSLIETGSPICLHTPGSPFSGSEPALGSSHVSHWQSTRKGKCRPHFMEKQTKSRKAVARQDQRWGLNLLLSQQVKGRQVPLLPKRGALLGLVPRLGSHTGDRTGPRGGKLGILAATLLEVGSSSAWCPGSWES